MPPSESRARFLGWSGDNVTGVLRPPSPRTPPWVVSHCVSVVGWGEDAGVPYWLVQNSFGDTWGEGGFVRVEGAGAWGLEGLWYALTPHASNRPISDNITAPTATTAALAADVPLVVAITVGGAVLLAAAFVAWYRPSDYL